MEYDYISFKLPDEKATRRGYFEKDVSDYIFEIYGVKIKSLAGSFDLKAVNELQANHKSPIYNTIPYWLRGFETNSAHFKRVYNL